MIGCGFKSFGHTYMINSNSGFCEHKNRISGDKIQRNSFTPKKGKPLIKDAAP